MPSEIRRSLGGIVSDLWGTPSPAPKSAAVPAAPAQSEPAPVAPPLDRLWAAVDETVDWTEVLAHAAPTDTLTSPERWNLYRQYAAQVLSGDPAAYLAVLKAADPLRDLTPWADKLDTACVDADTLRVTFHALPALIARDGRRYLAGVSLRIARDLMALLPVTQVEVTAVCEGQTCLSVAFGRQDLQKVRFGFIDPVTFAVDCGGVFTE